MTIYNLIQYLCDMILKEGGGRDKKNSIFSSHDMITKNNIL